MEMWWLSVPFALVLCLILSWLSTGDEDINYHESTMMRVSLRECFSSPARSLFVRVYVISQPSHLASLFSSSFRTGNPVRESGPPACMAKLIMMRHRVRLKEPPSLASGFLTTTLTYPPFPHFPDKPSQLEEKGRNRINTAPLAIPITRPQTLTTTSHTIPNQVPEPCLAAIQPALGKAIPLTFSFSFPSLLSGLGHFVGATRVGVACDDVITTLFTLGTFFIFFFYLKKKTLLCRASFTAI